MSVAILVLAAHHPGVLKENIELLSHARVKTFVHIDAKSDRGPFGFVASQPRALLLERSHPVFWGGFNMILAEVELLRQALLDASLTRFVLISDDSFSLRSAPELVALLDPPMNWIGQYDITSNALAERYRNFYFFDSLATTPQPIQPELRRFGSEEADHLGRLERLRQTGKKPLGRIVHGAQWWALTRETAQYFVNVFDADIHLRESFQFSAIPDEQYVHTVLASKIRPGESRDTHMYFDFSREPKPFVFTEADHVKSAMASDRLFIRKLKSGSRALDYLRDHCRARAGMG